MKKPVVVILLIVILLAALGGGWWWYQSSRQQPLTLYGNVDIRTVNMSFRVGGRLASLTVDEGDSIRAGPSGNAAGGEIRKNSAALLFS
jgi:HlyD family secretion protein